MNKKLSITTSKLLAVTVLAAASVGAQHAFAETNRLCAEGDNSNCFLAGNFPRAVILATGLDIDDEAARTIRYIDGEWSMGDVVIGSFGAAGWTPVVGDWDGDGYDNIGAFNNGMWIYKNSWNFVDAGYDITRHIYGDGSWMPLVGDWSSDGETVDGLGLYKDGVFRIRLDTNDPASEVVITFNNLPASDEYGSVPVAGRFKGDYEQVGIIDGTVAKYVEDNISATYDFLVSDTGVSEGTLTRILENERHVVVMDDSTIVLSQLPDDPTPLRCPTDSFYFCAWLDNTVDRPEDSGRTDEPRPQPF